MSSESPKPIKERVGEIAKQAFDVGRLALSATGARLTLIGEELGERAERVGERAEQAFDVGRLALSAAGVRLTLVREARGERALDSAADSHQEAISTQKTVRSIGLESLLTSDIYRRSGRQVPDRESSNLYTQLKDWRMNRKIEKYRDAKVHAKKQRSARGPITNIRRTRLNKITGRLSAGRDFLSGTVDASTARRRIREADRTIITKVDRPTSRSVSREQKKQKKVGDYSRLIMRRAHRKTRRAEKQVMRKGRQQARNRNAVTRKREEHEDLKSEISSK